jgi:hypothetical protein
MRAKIFQNGVKRGDLAWASGKNAALLHNSKVTKICLFSAILMGEIFI